MAVSFKLGLLVSGSYESITRQRENNGVLRFNHFNGGLHFSPDFLGKPISLIDQKGSRNLSLQAQSSNYVSKFLRWWEKTSEPNMVEIHSAQELIDSLLNAGDRLVIVDFYSPGCGGCKALHPKICQLAGLNPDAIFLKVNYEELKKMCQILHIHVLPFFRFYRGSEGKLCSFSCTNATIKKFKDALAKHGVDRCSIGPAKGVEQTEILKLAAVGEISEKRQSFNADLVLKGNSGGWWS
ncbi:thioredoxin-like 1-2, chloroplastic [Impatiens glandulifera]|uniref:thioredoxin-like 1-2, chloroplastic n=1 Tax=Impatiens glandulifera TaxID=253017 RepID=UPI001FB1208F|nr:thioredoxin-like 1-2, chloroplastic [Impatiens glandulifera]